MTDIESSSCHVRGSRALNLCESVHTPKGGWLRSALAGEAECHGMLCDMRPKCCRSFEICTLMSMRVSVEVKCWPIFRAGLARR